MPRQAHIRKTTVTGGQNGAPADFPTSDKPLPTFHQVEYQEVKVFLSLTAFPCSFFLSLGSSILAESCIWKYLRCLRQ